MKIINSEIFCEKINKKFKIVEFSFNFLEDKKLLNNLYIEGQELAKKLNPVLARDSSKKRKFETVLSNAIAGIMSEYCWRYWLNKKSLEENKGISFNKVEMLDLKNQIDIEISYPNGIKKLIEVRSSFPYTGIKNAICRVFDIIGWYANQIKIQEIKKDFYVRALFPYKSSDFLPLLKNKFSVFLCGGSSKELLESSPNSKDKTFIPYDELILESIKYTKYRVLEPIINAKDTLNIAKEMLQ